MANVHPSWKESVIYYFDNGRIREFDRRPFAEGWTSESVLKTNINLVHSILCSNKRFSKVNEINGPQDWQMDLETSNDDSTLLAVSMAFAFETDEYVLTWAKKPNPISPIVFSKIKD